MNVHRTLITMIFRGMVVVSRSIPTLSKSLGQKQPITLHPTSAFGPINPYTFAYSSSARNLDGSNGYNFGGERGFGKNSPCSSEHGHDERSKAFPEFSQPRPQHVPWQKEIANRVYFIGEIARPIKFKLTQSGKAYAWTSLVVRTGSQTTWLQLQFWDELAETAAQHLKQSNIVHVSGFLTSNAVAGKDGQQRQFYQVHAQTVNFVERKASTFAQQVDVNENAWSPVVSQQTVSYSGKNAQIDTAFIESLWQAFFTCPLEWWDYRTNKTNPKAPDFKHKNTGNSLWIEGTSNPPWVKSELALLDSRMSGLEESGKGGSSARPQGSLSSSQDCGF